jgi:hypothetical protein
MGRSKFPNVCLMDARLLCRDCCCASLLLLLSAIYKREAEPLLVCRAESLLPAD